MPQIINDRIRLREIITRLKEHGQEGYKLPLIYSLESTLVGTMAMEAVVDKWPDWTHLFVRPNDKKANLPFMQTRSYPYSENSSTFKKFIMTPGVVDWWRKQSFVAFHCSLKQAIERAGNYYGGYITQSAPNHVITETEAARVKEMDYKLRNIIKRLPEVYELGILMPKDAKFIVENWKDIKDISQEGRKNLIKMYEFLLARTVSSCVFDPEGNPVSWALAKIDRSGGMTNTLKEYQNKGFYTIVHADLVLKMTQARMPSYGYVLPSNKVALHMSIDKFGGKIKGEVAYLDYYPPHSTKL